MSQPTVPLCQRWSHRNPSFVPTSAGGFDPGRYTVEAIDETTAKTYVVTHHYTGSFPAARFRFGLFHQGSDRVDLVGVAVYGVPVSKRALTNVFPDLEPYVESIELSRLILEGPAGGEANSLYRDEPGYRAPSNAESWFVARCHEHLAARHIRGVIAFSDPMPRNTSDGHQIIPGHIGVIYQALNATYTGRGTARTLTMFPDGTVFNDRTRQKILSADRGDRHAINQLVARGAPALSVNDDPTDRAAWLHDALSAVGAQRVRHPGNHRYAFTLGETRSARRNVTVALPSLAFPKPSDIHLLDRGSFALGTPP